MNEFVLNFIETLIKLFQVQKVLASGDRVIVFPNGTIKEISADKLSTKVTFFNGDTKQMTADHRVVRRFILKCGWTPVPSRPSVAPGGSSID